VGIFNSRHTKRTNVGQAQRIAKYSEATEGAQWYVFWYEIANWVLSDMSVVGKMATGTVLQFRIYQQLKEELDADLQEIAYETAKKKR
jgi:hypothetical protein